MNNGLIVVTDENGVVSITTIDKQSYEQKFIQVCQNTVSNWDEHTQNDIDNILNDGVYSTLNGKNIAIIWLDEDGEYNS